jgi:hypothetical protein
MVKKLDATKGNIKECLDTHLVKQCTSEDILNAESMVKLIAELKEKFKTLYHMTRELSC